jgi:predicted alpha/beta hydrolase
VAIQTIEVRTADGQTLVADVREPEAERTKGVVILAHALFARRTEFERPRGDGLARLFARAGYVTVAFDFRGHGESGPGVRSGAGWSYDDLVRADLPAVTSCAKSRYPDLPVVVVGHSLGGHVALASQATGALSADALVLVAANVWMRHLEASTRTWVTKRAIAEALVVFSRRLGYLPARALRLGSDDEGASLLLSLVRTTRLGRWTSDDGRVDYGAAVGTIGVPVATVTSTGDRLLCTPACGERMVRAVRGPRLSERVTRCDDGAPAPGHMELVTSGRVRQVYRRVVVWLERVLAGPTLE